MSTANSHGTALSVAATVADPVIFLPATEHSPPNLCVVAEINVNHDGMVNRAIELVEAAADVDAHLEKIIGRTMGRPVRANSIL